MSAVGLVYACGAREAAAPEQLALLRALQEKPPAGQQQQQQQQLPPYDPSRLKKHGKNGQPPPIAVAKRNARERNRVKQVNNGFATLRQHIPSHVAQGYGDRGKKLSKVETLRMAVEYIHGLQRLLSEADGLEYEGSRAQVAAADSSGMIPSPSNSVYSSSTHNGSAEVLCLAGSELDEPHSAAAEPPALDEDADPEAYFLDEDLDEEEEPKDRPAKRFREEDSRAKSRLAENQNRERSLLGAGPRRRRNSPGGPYYGSRQSAAFGDEENIEPPGNLRTTATTNNNNNSSTANNNNNNNNSSGNGGFLSSFSPILMQTSSPTSGGLPSIKRELQLLDEEESRRSSEEEAGIVLSASSPYPGEILVESPGSGRLVPLKLEEHEASAQLVYVSAEGLPAATYYKHDFPEGPAEFIDMVSWWEQEPGRLVGLPAHHHHHHHHHHHVGQHHHQPHQAMGAAQQRLTHV